MTATASATTATGCRAPTPLPAADDDPLVTTAAVNLRSAPGTDCPVLRVLDPGTTVAPRGQPVSAVAPRGQPVSANGRLWLPIEADGTRGWAATDFLSPIGS